MDWSVAVLSQDASSLSTLQTVFEDTGIDPVICRTPQQALEQVIDGACSTLLVDFDLPGVRHVLRVADFFPAGQKPILLAIATRVWPGTGDVFQSGASRILYKPLARPEVKDALDACRRNLRHNRRRSSRHDMMRSVVYLELDTGTIPGIGLDISEHGFAVQATDPIPVRSSIPFRFVLPGTHQKLHGHADVIWAGDHGRAGFFFSQLSPAARKQLKQWLKKGARSRSHDDLVRALLPPDGAVCETIAE